MPNLIYRNREATKWFVPAAATQAEDAAFEVAALANNAGRQSAPIDLGEGAVARLYEWRGFVQCQATPAVGSVIRIYLKTEGSSASATVHPDNDDGVTEGAVSAENKLRNLHLIGSIVVDEAAADTEFVASGLVEIVGRAVQVVFWNASGAVLTTDVNESGFMLSPVPDEIQ